MIKRIPGWLNFFLLAAIYAVVIVFLRWITKSVCEDWFLIIIVTTYAGGYLSKWRFYDGSWHLD